LPVLEGYATPEGLVGDSWRNPQFHGGPKQAVLIICAEAIADLCSQGFALYPGALGENLTVAGLDRLRFRIGQHWQVGEAVVVLTKIRVPCKTLNIYGAGTIQKAVYDSQVKAGDPASPLWAKGGIYGAVIRAGAVRPGDAIELLAEP
jgi:MOSC domain-containing protein YiiM